MTTDTVGNTVGNTWENDSAHGLYPGSFQLPADCFQGVCCGRPALFVGAIENDSCWVSSLDFPEFWVVVDYHGVRVRGRVPGAGGRVALLCSRVSGGSVEVWSPHVPRQQFHVALTPPCASTTAFFD